MKGVKIMGHKNYTKYSENSEQIKNNEMEIDANKITDITPVNEIPENTEVKEGINIIENPEEPEVITSTGETVDDMAGESNVNPEIPENKEGATAVGTVVKCSKLNVRKEPSKDSDVVCVFSKNYTVTIDLDNSTDDFYKVILPIGEGYCMKNFIEIK